MHNERTRQSWINRARARLCVCV